MPMVLLLNFGFAGKEDGEVEEKTSTSNLLNGKNISLKMNSFIIPIAPEVDKGGIQHPTAREVIDQLGMNHKEELYKNKQV